MAQGGQHDLNTMMDWDLYLLQKINQEWTHPVLDWLLPAVSCIKAWAPLLILLLLYVFWRGGRKQRQMLLCILLALSFGDGVLGNILKKHTNRIRPRDAMDEVVIRDLGKAPQPEIRRLFVPTVQRPGMKRENPDRKSFPSSHTVNMFALATCIGLFHRRWGILAYLIAATVAWSRVYMGAHWPSDVIPSIGIGILLGWGAVQLVTWGSFKLASYRSSTATEKRTRASLATNPTE